MNLSEISFPVFHIRSLGTPSKAEGVSFIYQEIEKGENVIPVIKVIDDINVKGDTLAKRRLQLLKDEVRLQKLNYAFFFLADLIKYAKPHHNFIDSNGKIFKYKKSTSANLTFHKITKVFPIATGGAVIEVSGIMSRFKVLFQPDESMTHAGILTLGFSNHVLYGLYDQEYKPSRRKV